MRTSTAKDWFYRYEVAGKGRKRGLGPYPTISVEQARSDALECRQLRKQGLDPVDHAKAVKQQEALTAAKNVTFKECALAYIKSHKRGWKNAKHESQWRNTLDTYAYPVIGDIGVQEVDIGLVMDVLEPIWYEKTETASRVRQRIENILDWATVKKLSKRGQPSPMAGTARQTLTETNQGTKTYPLPGYGLQGIARILQRAKETKFSGYTYTIVHHTDGSQKR